MSNYNLPRCEHGNALSDWGGEWLSPSCGCFFDNVTEELQKQMALIKLRNSFSQQVQPPSPQGGLKIDKNIKLPKNSVDTDSPRHQFFTLLPKMEVGDSILITDRSYTTIWQNWLPRLQREKHFIKYPETKKCADWTFEVHKADGGVRVWRVD